MRKKFLRRLTIILILVISIFGILVAKKKIERYKIENSGMLITLIGGTNTKQSGVNLNSCGYIVENSNGDIIVVDGGRTKDAEVIYSYLQKFGKREITAWYITHPHEDHVGALIEMLNNDIYDFTIKNLYYSFNTLEWYEEFDSRGYPSEKEMFASMESNKIQNKISCQKGQIISMGNIECEILRIANPKVIDSDNGNDSSMCFKFNAIDVNKSMLFLGDAYVYTSKELLEEPEKLKSYAVQMAHHGQYGVTQEVYKAIDPELCFFNSTVALWNNDQGGGYNTGKWQTVIVRGWLNELGTTNFVAYEGNQTVRFTKDGYEKVDLNI